MDWQSGDILCFYGSEIPSRFISAVTSWPIDPWSCWLPPSHVGIICMDRGVHVLVESTTFCKHPCIMRGEQVNGVQVHLPGTRIHDYTDRGGRVDVYRLNPLFRLSIAEQLELRRCLIDELVGRKASYDFKGAFSSALKFRRLFRFLFTADIDTIFCSELVAVVLQQLGRMNHEDPLLYSPGRLMRTLKRIGKYQLHHRNLKLDDWQAVQSSGYGRAA